MSEESNDVTKALAAFGAPSIRYHSFGQAQSKQPGANPVRPPGCRDRAARDDGPAGRQSDLRAAGGAGRSAVEPMPTARMLPEPEAPMSTPRPAPFLSEPRPCAGRAAVSVHRPSVAPPPRPLAEWAAPVSHPSVPSRPGRRAPLSRRLPGFRCRPRPTVPAPPVPAPLAYPPARNGDGVAVPCTGGLAGHYGVRRSCPGRE